MTRKEFTFGIYEMSITHIRIFSPESGGILRKWPLANQFHDFRSISLFYSDEKAQCPRAGPEIRKLK